ncbi:hypothetical protein [Paenibacillus campi]|nr:hypothetical protein [Paenibacillus sp. SGZ-1014]
MITKVNSSVRRWNDTHKWMAIRHFISYSALSAYPVKQSVTVHL